MIWFLELENPKLALSLCLSVYELGVQALNPVPPAVAAAMAEIRKFECTDLVYDNLRRHMYSLQARAFELDSSEFINGLLNLHYHTPTYPLDHRISLSFQLAMNFLADVFKASYEAVAMKLAEQIRVTVPVFPTPLSHSVAETGFNGRDCA